MPLTLDNGGFHPVLWQGGPSGKFLMKQKKKPGWKENPLLVLSRSKTSRKSRLITKTVISLQHLPVKGEPKRVLHSYRWIWGGGECPETNQKKKEKKKEQTKKGRKLALLSVHRKRKRTGSFGRQRKPNDITSCWARRAQRLENQAKRDAQTTPPCRVT